MDWKTDAPGLFFAISSCRNMITKNASLPVGIIWLTGIHSCLSEPIKLLPPAESMGVSPLTAYMNLHMNLNPLLPATEAAETAVGKVEHHVRGARIETV